MAKVSIKQFAANHNLKVTQVYTILRNNKHLKSKVKGLGVLVDEDKFKRMTA